MKITLRLAAMLLFAGMAMPAFAQAPSGDATPGHGHHHHHGGDFAKRLGLSDAQKTQWEEIRKSTPEGAQRDAAIAKILTPEQQQKWADMKARRKQHDS